MSEREREGEKEGEKGGRDVREGRERGGHEDEEEMKRENSNVVKILHLSPCVTCLIFPD